jgi:hypothetical protein
MTACAECSATLPSGAKACSSCGSPVGPWGSCPECKAAITAELAACRECGFPLKPKAAPPSPLLPPPPPAPASSRATTRTRKHRKASRGPSAHDEPSEAMVFAVVGLFIPILAIFGLMQSRKGSGAYILSWIGIGLWIVNVLVIATLVVRKVS